MLNENTVAADSHMPEPNRKYVINKKQVLLLISLDTCSNYYGGRIPATYPFGMGIVCSLMTS